MELAALPLGNGGRQQAAGEVLKAVLAQAARHELEEAMLTEEGAGALDALLQVRACFTLGIDSNWRRRLVRSLSRQS